MSAVGSTGTGSNADEVTTDPGAIESRNHSPEPTEGRSTTASGGFGGVDAFRILVNSRAG